MNKNSEEHRAPWECTFAKEDKSKCKSGTPPKSDQQYFEIICLCILQAGLSWRMVRKNWPKFKRGFYDFNIRRLANAKNNEVLEREGIIKNENKVKAIINNAKEFENIKQNKGSFSNFLKLLKRKGSKEVIKTLSRHFSHIGEYTAEYYLHSVGYW
jgi:DNA-3-methyladenine glycosylase I